MGKSRGSLRAIAHNIRSDAFYGLEIFHCILGLWRNKEIETALRYSEPVLVGIDFENANSFRRGQPQNTDEPNNQAGLAILDTRDLWKQNIPPEDMIKTFNFVSGAVGYQQTAYLKFLFGSPTETSQRDMLASITGCIPEGRNIVLIGHGFWNDLRALMKLGFDFQQMKVSAYLDTYTICGRVLPRDQCSLGELLSQLGCSHCNLHNAGNDANFALRALLLMAVRSCPSQFRYSPLIHDLEEIAHSPYVIKLPGSLCPSLIKSQEKRVIWSEEKIAHNRAERMEMRTAERLVAEDPEAVLMATTEIRM